MRTIRQTTLGKLLLPRVPAVLSATPEEIEQAGQVLLDHTRKLTHLGAPPPLELFPGKAPDRAANADISYERKLWPWISLEIGCTLFPEACIAAIHPDRSAIETCNVYSPILIRYPSKSANNNLPRRYTWRFLVSARNVRGEFVTFCRGEHAAQTSRIEGVPCFHQMGPCFSILQMETKDREVLTDRPVSLQTIGTIFSRRAFDEGVDLLEACAQEQHPFGPKNALSRGNADMKQRLLMSPIYRELYREILSRVDDHTSPSRGSPHPKGSPIHVLEVKRFHESQGDEQCSIRLGIASNGTRRVFSARLCLSPDYPDAGFLQINLRSWS